MSLTIACVFVRGHVGFTAEYVERLRDMCERFGPEHDFVCLTDQPKKLPFAIDVIETERVERGMFAWWKKLELFKHERLRHSRVLYLDLDVLVVDELAPIVNFDAPFALIPTEGDFAGKNGLAVVKRFNSSCMVWDGGVLDWLFDEWRPEVARRLWGDQDWIGEKAYAASTFPLEWFPRLSAIGPSGEIPPAAKVILCKKPKNTEAAARYPWFRERWRY